MRKYIIPKSIFIQIPVIVCLLLALPLAGIILAGYPLQRYLEFPPESRFIVHASFSRTAFVVIALFVLVSLVPFIMAGTKKVAPGKGPLPGRFPWWGWAGVISMLFFWFVAWTRYQLFSILQPYTFVPLWFSYIVVVNALTFRRAGICLLYNAPGYFALLFPVSAGFWWFFEYLNRFVQNWFYVGAHYGAATYFLLATLSFSTVLPAVLSTRELLMTFPGLRRRFQGLLAIRPAHPSLIACAVLIASSMGLCCVGIFTDYLFPLLWVSPLLIIVSLNALFKEGHVFSPVVRGDWSFIVVSALASLICGFFWEMWNFYSLVKWEYSIPLVDVFKIFEMPILGYAGYLPFGLECAVIGDMLKRYLWQSEE